MPGPDGPQVPREEHPRAAARPRWWAVLAVSLALMALVAAVTSSAHHAAQSRTAATRHAPRSDGRLGPRPTATTSLPAAPGSVALPTVPTTAGSEGTSASGGASTPAGTGGSGGTTTSGGNPVSGTASATGTTSGSGGQVEVGAVVDGPGTRSATPTSTTEPAGQVTGSTAPPPASAGTSTGSTTQSDPGYLTYPDDVSAGYPISTSSAVKATATWSGAPDLSLSISCPGRKAQQSGTSGVSVSVPAATPSVGGSGTCSVEIAEPTTTEATVSYSLTIHYTKS